MNNKTYDFITDVSNKLQMMKGYLTSYSNPKKGKMIVNFNGMNFIVDVKELGEGKLEDAVAENSYLFN